MGANNATIKRQQSAATGQRRHGGALALCHLSRRPMPAHEFTPCTGRSRGDYTGTLPLRVAEGLPPLSCDDCLPGDTGSAMCRASNGGRASWLLPSGSPNLGRTACKPFGRSVHCAGREAQGAQAVAWGVRAKQEARRTAKRAVRRLCPGLSPRVSGGVVSLCRAGNTKQNAASEERTPRLLIVTGQLCTRS